MGEVVIKVGLLPYSDGSGDNITVTVCTSRNGDPTVRINQFENDVIVDLEQWEKVKRGVEAAIAAFMVAYREASK